MGNTATKIYLEKWKAMATATGTKVAEFPNIFCALPYILELVTRKSPCEILDLDLFEKEFFSNKTPQAIPNETPQEASKKGDLSPNGVHTRFQPVLAAPKLPPKAYQTLETLCCEKGYHLISQGVRKYASGIDLGVAVAEMGIAQTGSCVLDCTQEDIRLATMICEICVLILPKTSLVGSLFEAEEFICARLNQDFGSHLTFLSGPSRTADIERVPATGVHGCLEMHVIIVDEFNNDVYEGV